MKDKPIIFSTEMVQAIQEGRKTQTRRVIKSQHEMILFFGKDTWVGDESIMGGFRVYGDKIKCPYQIGQKLWVRETWHGCKSIFDSVSGQKKIGVRYKADNIENNFKWKSPMFMPKKYARIWLEVTDVRVERLQDITESDCIKEGITKDDINYCGSHPAIIAFYCLWDKLNKKRGYGWDANPWVWVIEFKRIKGGYKKI